MFEHVVFHGAVEEQENIQTKGVINFGGGKSQKKRKYESSHCKHKKAWGSNKRCSQRMEEVQNKEKDGRECIHGSNPQDKGNAHFEWQKLPPHL